MNIVQLNTQVGKIFIPEKDSYIKGTLQENGVWEPTTLNECLKHLKPDSIVVEVGSHVGSHTLKLARHCKFLYSFEMQRLLFHILNTNLMFNGITNVIPFLGGVSNENKKVYSVEVDWKELKDFNSGNLKIEKLQAEAHEQSFFAMDIVKLDDHLKLIPYISLLKIDAEGHEHKVLEGAINLIKKHKPIIVTEFHTIKTDYTGEKGNYPMIKDMLEPDYTLEYFRERTTLKDGTIFDNLNLIGVPK